MQERKLDWCEKIPVGIMQLGTNLDIYGPMRKQKGCCRLSKFLRQGESRMDSIRNWRWP